MNFEQIFTEWTYHALNRDLRSRDFDIAETVRLSRNKIVALTGIRRSGKSSLLMLIGKSLQKEGKRVGYVNLEDMRIKDMAELWDALTLWCGQEEFYLLLDEITAAPGWEGWLMRMHEMAKERLHIIVTSSCSKLVHPPKALRGRVLAIMVFPLSFNEYLEFSDASPPPGPAGSLAIRKMLDDYLLWGGFPEVSVCCDRTDRVMLLSSYYEQVLNLDVAAENRLDTSEVKKVGAIMLRSPYFSSNNVLMLLRSIGHVGSKPRLLTLEQLMTDSYLFHFSKIFSYNIKDGLQYPRKCYCADNGFFLAIGPDVGAGRRWENMVYLSMLRSLESFESLHYWKDRQGREVDIIMLRKERPEAMVQVCSDLSDPDVRKREVSALLRCGDEIGAKKGYLVNPDQAWMADIDGLVVQAVPLVDWLRYWPSLPEGRAIVEPSVYLAIRPRRKRTKDPA